MCVREKGGERQVEPYGFGRIALYKASWRGERLRERERERERERRETERERERREFSGRKMEKRDGQWTTLIYLGTGLDE